MDSTIQKAAAGYIAPKVMKGFRFRWLVYGAAAYYGLKLLNKRGILPRQTTAALGFIDRGLSLVKQQIGLGEFNRTSTESANSAANQVAH